MTWNANFGASHSTVKKQRGISDKGCEDSTGWKFCSHWPADSLVLINALSTWLLWTLDFPSVFPSVSVTWSQNYCLSGERKWGREGVGGSKQQKGWEGQRDHSINKSNFIFFHWSRSDVMLQSFISIGRYFSFLFCFDRISSQIQYLYWISLLFESHSRFWAVSVNAAFAKEKNSKVKIKTDK